jgi:cyclopropane-fatty-acyl-phospholipid synthase
MQSNLQVDRGENLRAMARDSLARSLSETLSSVFAGYRGRLFAIRLWDGWLWKSSEGQPACTIVIHSAGALHSLIARPSEITLGEAYIAKEIDVEGDLFSVFDAAEHIFQSHRGAKQRIIEGANKLLHEISNLRKGPIHSLNRDGASISYHYDQPIAFYRPWLGNTLAYSCAYFQSPSDAIDTAQSNKLELICRKLRLQPDESFLDIGCGWGSLILHAGNYSQS